MMVWPVSINLRIINRSKERRIEAAEKRGLQQILRVVWTAKKTSDWHWVLEKPVVRRVFLTLATAKTMMSRYFGHVKVETA